MASNNTTNRQPRGGMSFIVVSLFIGMAQSQKGNPPTR
jgi:hypothetical protein